MDIKDLKPTILTLQHSEYKCTKEMPWDANMYELLDAFIGVCVSMGYHQTSVDEVLEEYVDNLKENNKDYDNRTVQD